MPGLRPCVEPRCPRLVRVGRDRCEIHQAAHADTRPYHTARWQRLRALVLAEQPFCIDCQQQDIATPATHVDHIVPHRGDPALLWSRANLQGLCASHHSQKTALGE